VQNLINIELWNKAQERLAAATGLYTYTLDTNGTRIAGSKPPFALEQLEHDQNYLKWQQNISLQVDNNLFTCEDPAGLTTIILPVRINNRTAGCIVMGGIRTATTQLKPPDPDLLTALQALPVADKDALKNYATLLTSTTEIIFPALAEAKDSTNRVQELQLLVEYSGLILGVLDQEQLIEISLAYFANKLKLANASITHESHTYRHIPNPATSNAYSRVEAILLQHVSESKTLLAVPNVQTSFFFQNTGSRNLLPISLLSAPIRDGTVTFYSYNDLTPQTHLCSALASQFSTALEKARQYRSVRQSAITDPLTGIRNRAYFKTALSTELLRSNSLQAPTSLIILDVDNFKKYNDTYGHPAGDGLLKEITQTAASVLAKEELIARYGGEEFVILLPGTNSEEALARAEAVRIAIESRGHATVSIGFATTKQSTATPDQLIQSSDECLYKAKKEGKNRVIGTEIAI